jgi:hypothetical protein
MIKTGSKVKIIDILDKTDANHLVRFVGNQGEVISYQYITNEDEINDIKRCKVRLYGIEETYYFISKGELEEI